MSDTALRTPALQKQPEVREEVSALVVPNEANDNENLALRQQPEARMFELPSAIWIAMIGSYAVFLAALLGATGGSRAAFAILISVVYIAMFFGVARVMLGQSNPQPPSPLDRSGSKLQSLYGPLGRLEVYTQVLVVPFAVAAFGIAISVIAALVF